MKDTDKKFKGRVIHGAGRGHDLGYPTLNLAVEDPDLVSDLGHGVYAVKVLAQEQLHRGAMNWGPRPTFGEATPLVEIFLVDFEGDLYGESIEVQLVKRLRDVQKFSSKEALVTQIERDVAELRTLI